MVGIAERTDLTPAVVPPQEEIVPLSPVSSRHHLAEEQQARPMPIFFIAGFVSCVQEDAGLRTGLRRLA